MIMGILKISVVMIMDQKIILCVYGVINSLLILNRKVTFISCGADNDVFFFCALRNFMKNIHVDILWKKAVV